MPKNCSEIPLLLFDRNTAGEAKENLLGNSWFKGNVLECTQLLTIYKMQSYTKGKNTKHSCQRLRLSKNNCH